MTDGHKHREVHVRYDSRIARLLRRPLYWTMDREKADRSPYPYGPGPTQQPYYPEPWAWYLSGLSILHRWTGLTLRYPDNDGEVTDD